MTTNDNPLVTIARLIDPDAWAHADEYAAMTEAATPQMRPFFEQQVHRIVKPSIEASSRVLKHLTAPPADEPIPDVLSEVTKPTKSHRRKRRA